MSEAKTSNYGENSTIICTKFSLKYGSSKTLSVLVSGWGMKMSAPSRVRVNNE